MKYRLMDDDGFCWDKVEVPTLQDAIAEVQRQIELLGVDDSLEIWRDDTAEHLVTVTRTVSWEVTRHES